MERICPGCQRPLQETDTVVTCGKCGAAYHEECWKANDGCGLCKETPEAAPTYKNNFCARCGGALSENQAFCPHCGTPVAPVTPTAADPWTYQLPAPKKKRKVGLIIGIIVGVIVLILAGLFLIGSLAGDDNSTTSSIDDTYTSADSWDSEDSYDTDDSWDSEDSYDYDDSWDSDDSYDWSYSDVDPESVIVDIWDGVVSSVDDEDIFLPDDFATAYIHADHTGTVFVEDDYIEFTWSYDETDEEGDMLYIISYSDVDVGAMLYDPLDESLVIGFTEDLLILFERS